MWNSTSEILTISLLNSWIASNYLFFFSFGLSPLSLLLPWIVIDFVWWRISKMEGEGGEEGRFCGLLACSACGCCLPRWNSLEILALTGTALVPGILQPLLPSLLLTASLLTLLCHHPRRCLSNQGKTLQLYQTLSLSINMILRVVQK